MPGDSIRPCQAVPTPYRAGHRSAGHLDRFFDHCVGADYAGTLIREDWLAQLAMKLNKTLIACTLALAALNPALAQSAEGHSDWPGSCK